MTNEPMFLIGSNSLTVILLDGQMPVLNAIGICLTDHWVRITMSVLSDLKGRVLWSSSQTKYITLHDFYILPPGETCTINSILMSLENVQA